MTLLYQKESIYLRYKKCAKGMIKLHTHTKKNKTAKTNVGVHKNFENKFYHGVISNSKI